MMILMMKMMMILKTVMMINKMMRILERNLILMMKMKKMMNRKNLELRKRERDSLTSGKSLARILNWVLLKILLTDQNSLKFLDGTHQETRLN